MKTLVIDAGHGGKDPGAVGPAGLQEKDVTLAVARLVRDMLHGAVRVVLTRDGDEYLSLSRRASLANATTADLFLSIHCNAGGGTGFECFHAPGSTGGRRASDALVAAYWAAWPERINRGRKEARFTVLTKTRMPAALFELEFLDTQEEWLADPIHQERCAEALVDGVLDFFGMRRDAVADSPRRSDADAAGRTGTGAEQWSEVRRLAQQILEVTGR